MKRGTPINKFATIPRYVRVRKKRKGGPRRGPLRDKKYREWISEHWSVLSPHARPGLRMMLPISEPCHTENNGMSSKGPDSSCIPLTRKEHRQFDADREGFQQKHGFNARELAAQYYARYQEEHSA